MNSLNCYLSVNSAIYCYHGIELVSEIFLTDVSGF